MTLRWPRADAALEAIPDQQKTMHRLGPYFLQGPASVLGSVSSDRLEQLKGQQAQPSNRFRCTAIWKSAWVCGSSLLEQPAACPVAAKHAATGDLNRATIVSICPETVLVKPAVASPNAGPSRSPLRPATARVEARAHRPSGKSLWHVVWDLEVICKCCSCFARVVLKEPWGPTLVRVQGVRLR